MALGLTPTQVPGDHEKFREAASIAAEAGGWAQGAADALWLCKLLPARATPGKRPWGCLPCSLPVIPGGSQPALREQRNLTCQRTRVMNDCYTVIHNAGPGQTLTSGGSDVLTTMSRRGPGVHPEHKGKPQRTLGTVSCAGQGRYDPLSLEDGGGLSDLNARAPSSPDLH